MSNPLSRRAALKLGAIAGAGLLAGPRSPAAASDNERDELADLLRELVTRYQLPGAIAGVSRAGTVLTAAVGTANLNTGAPMRPELGFITGSITKVWTTTMVMTFVEEGAISLDAPLVEYLPGLRFGDPEATRVLTMRHMLNHTSGLDAGDFILELGEGPCAHKLFVEALGKIGQIHRPGAYSSYCNGGFVVAAHVLETRTGKSWKQLLQERVIGPMGLERTFPDAEDGVLHGMVVGNLPDRAAPGGYRAVPKLLLPKSIAPAGSTLVVNVEDQLRFARMHLAGGVTDRGARVLEAESVRLMATRTTDAPYPTVPGFGLGWMHAVSGGETTLSHSGGSNGGRAMLVVLPGQNLAHASFVNTSAPGDFPAELHARLTSRYGRAVPATPPPASPSAGPIDRTRFVGTYRRTTTRITIKEEHGRLMLTSEWIPAEAEGTEAYGAGPAEPIEVVPVAPDGLGLPGTTRLDRSQGWIFLEPGPDGRFRYVYSGGRMARRIA
jgi:CubicO group peptidase (beta-lactamase class C family)